MSEKKNRLKRQAEAAQRRQIEAELEEWHKQDTACWFPSLAREDIAMARPLFVEADVCVIGKQA